MLSRPKKSNGFTLVELLVVIGVISILFGITLPAVQSVREAARRTSCLNNVRNLAIATQSYEAVHRSYPGPWFDAPPDSSSYSSDRGFFVLVLPFLEEGNRYDSFDLNSPAVSSLNQAPILKRPEILSCPNVSNNKLLHNLAGRFSGGPVDGLNAPMCDYRASVGWHDFDLIKEPDQIWRGIISNRVGNLSRHSRASDVIDGHSNTALLWESSSEHLKFPQSPARLEFDIDAVDGFRWSVNWPAGHVYNSRGQASSKTYLYCWAGFGTGSIRAYDIQGEIGNPLIDPRFNRAINVANNFGQPFSSHPAGCVFANADGSVHFMNEQIDAAIVVAYVTRGAGDSLDVNNVVE